MQPMQVHVLGPEGAGRSALEQALSRLGCTVSAADASARRPEPSGADILMLDVRGDAAHWDGLARDLRDDDRPVVVVSEGPTPLVRELVRRPGRTVLLTGDESDAGYRVALSVLRGLRESARGRAAEGIRDGSLTRVATL